MSFWRRDKEVIVHCYTDRAEVYNYFPVTHNKKAIPKWFKKLNAPYFNSPEDYENNLKLCPGFIDLFKTGFTMPLWSDLFLGIGEKGSESYRWQYSDMCSAIQFHNEKQHGGHFKATEFQHFKLISPWLFQCKENIEFLAVEPFWQFKDLKNISIVPGKLKFCRQPTTNINLFVRRELEKQEILLPAGSSIQTYIPITEKKVRIQTHLVSRSEMKKLDKMSYKMSFFNSYDKAAKIRSERKCPYKFDVEK